MNNKKSSKKNIAINNVASNVVHLEKTMTKKFLAIDKRFESIDKRFESIDKRFESIDKKISGLATKDDWLKFQDTILGEIRDMRDENALITGRNAINRDMLEDHETRITKLESHSFKV